MNSEYNIAYLGISSNMEDRFFNIEKGISLLLEKGIIINHYSSILEYPALIKDITKFNDQN